MMEPTEEDRRINPDLEIIGERLQALIDIRNACYRLGWRGEWHLIEGILSVLAVLVEGDTPPDSPAHKLASAIVNPPEDDADGIEIGDLKGEGKTER